MILLFTVVCVCYLFSKYVLCLPFTGCSIKTPLHAHYTKRPDVPLTLRCKLDCPGIIHGVWSCNGVSVMGDSGHTVGTTDEIQTLTIKTLLPQFDSHSYTFEVDDKSTTAQVHKGRY